MSGKQSVEKCDDEMTNDILMDDTTHLSKLPKKANQHHQRQQNMNLTMVMEY